MSTETEPLPDRLHAAWDQLSNIRVALTTHPEAVTLDRLRVMCGRMVDVEGAILDAETALRAAETAQSGR